MARLLVLVLTLVLLVGSALGSIDALIQALGGGAVAPVPVPVYGGAPTRGFSFGYGIRP